MALIGEWSRPRGGHSVGAILKGVGHVIPHGWQSLPIGEVCITVSVGIVVRPAQYYVSATEGVRAFRSANIGVGYVRDDDWIFISREGHRRNPKSELKAGDVLIVRSGNAGIACVLPAKYAGVNCIDIVFARPKKNVVVPEYLCAFTNAELGRKQILRVQGGLALTHLNVGAYEKINIPLPPFKEQQQIVSYLDGCDRGVLHAVELTKGYRKLKSGLMHQLLNGRRRFPEFVRTNKTRSTRFGLYPADWEYPCVGLVAKEVSERSRSENRYTVLSCSKHQGLVDSLEYFGKRVYSSDTSNYKVVRRGQFAYATNHIEEGSIGLLSTHEAGLISPIYTVFETDARKVYAPFLFRLFKTELYRHIFEVNTSSSVDRRGSLRWTQFATIHVPLPALGEQRRIVEVLDTVDREIELLTRQADALTRQKKDLMQRLLTGQIRVKI